MVSVVNYARATDGQLEADTSVLQSEIQGGDDILDYYVG